MKGKTALLIGTLFFLIALITLPKYGINWDTINHLPRGQAYLHYFLTGKEDYSDLQEFFNGWQREGQWYWQDPDRLGIDVDIGKKNVPTRSMYQQNATPYQYFIDNDGPGHPPLSDILSAVSNRLFFGRLKLINDIDAYRIYGILLAACLVGLVYKWASLVYGKIAGLIATLSLVTYPLFWAESHFNTEKDIPQTVFWSFMFYTIWRGIVEKKRKWVVFFLILRRSMCRAWLFSPCLWYS